MKRILCYILADIYLLGLSVWGQTDAKTIIAKLTPYFESYQTTYTSKTDRCRIERININEDNRTLFIYLNEVFAGQSFNKEKIKLIYNEVKKLLPMPYNTYTTRLMGKNCAIEELAVDYFTEDSTQQRTWGKAIYRGIPWVQRAHLPYSTSRGLKNVHLSLWASHGRYYKNDTGLWSWQRPALYGTTEDLFTQTIVVPFLMPMLERAGAIIYSPRERDWQIHEAIIDNDTPQTGGTYLEHTGKYEWQGAGIGFCHKKDFYTDGENPFTMGSARIVDAVNKKSQQSTVRWTPSLSAPGQYAVYVSYPAMVTAIPDARYTICHAGVSTTVKVNQQMGASTWVYLGSYWFNPDEPKDNYISLSNMSNYRGTVGADAIRLGGGMGNMARGDSLSTSMSTSGLPRYLEGARYAAQWSGFPYEVYSSKMSANDYADDINVRSYATNYLAGGSSYVPGDSGLHVPVELAIGIHSDAGTAPDSTFVGTLGIYTTDFNNRRFAQGMSRLASRDLCDLVMTQIQSDISSTLGHWKRRQMFDRNYSESREPEVPSMILEMFSHQNFNDMKLGHDPYFKMLMARSIYKGILKYIAHQHGQDYVVQPLPVTQYYTALNEKEGTISLHWKPQHDTLEPTAVPTGYVVYTKQGNNDYDNGTYIKGNSYTFKASENTLYTFKVTAVNEGGESMPSTQLSAMLAPHAKSSILIVDAFNRLAGPKPIDNDTLRGFDLATDPGVPYMHTPAFCGPQQEFSRLVPIQEQGTSSFDWQGKLLTGNTFNHSEVHADAIASSGSYNITSCTREALENELINLSDYHIVDLILGLQKDDGYSLKRSPTLSESMCTQLRAFTRTHGSLLVSGSYIASHSITPFAVDFVKGTLKIDGYATNAAPLCNNITGMNTAFTLTSMFDENRYATPLGSTLIPTADAFSTLLYEHNRQSAAVAVIDEQYRAITLGFPFECIKYAVDRDKIMGAFLKFLLATE